MVTDKRYLVRYVRGGSWYMGIVKAWDKYTAVSIIQRLRNARYVDGVKLIKEDHLSYYRDIMQIEEVN